METLEHLQNIIPLFFYFIRRNYTLNDIIPSAASGGVSWINDKWVYVGIIHQTPPQLFDPTRMILYNKIMQLNQEQIDTLAKYFSDLSKILFGSTVLGFFIPSPEVQITLSMFIVGVSTTITCLVFSLKLLK